MTDDESGGGAPKARPGDDAVITFRTVRSGAEGRFVRLAGVADAILGRHAYPEPVSRALGEALGLTAMLGSALKTEGRLVLETRTDGPLRSLAVNFEAPGRLRGYAGFDREAVARSAAAPSGLLGSGHLALTIEPGRGGESYQGVVALDGGTLSDAARAYFRQSEQLPTFIRLVVARHFSGEDRATPDWHWRVGGLMIQHLSAKAREEASDVLEGDRPTGLDDEDVEEHWRRARLLAETVEDHELIDPTLSPERVLYRLFHEDGVRTRTPMPLVTYCRCSRERISVFLAQFSAEDLAALRNADGLITVTCEFCGSTYDFDHSEASTP